MNKSSRNVVGHILTVFLFLVQYKSASSLHLKADIPFVRNARQADAGCKLPPFPANGRYSMNGGDATPGETVDTFTIIDLECDFGYKASATVAFCQPTNTWSRQWQCEKLEVGCVVPDQPENGSHELETKVTLSPGISVEDYTVLHYSCNAGYNLTTTSSSSVCINGGWSSNPKCECSSRCVLPKMPTNGAYVIQKKDGVFTPGSSVEELTILEYTCNKGYAVSKNISVCQRTIWTSTPVCERLCKKLKSNSVSLSCNPDIEEGCPDGSVIIPVCKAGYSSNRTLETMTCLGGTWDLQKPKCELITCELETSDTVNFRCYDSNYSAKTCSNKIVDGKTVSFSCKEGFSRIEANYGVMFCSGGQWNIPIPRCSPNPLITTPQPVVKRINVNECALPSYPTHGKFTVTGPNKNLLPGTIVDDFTSIKYSCDTNYDAFTEINAYCEEGIWSVQPPICRKRCPMVQSHSVDFTCHQSGTEMNCPEFLPYGSKIVPTCKPGHEENPNEDLEVLKCVEDGKWDNPIQNCRPDCGLEKPVGGALILNGEIAKKYTFPWHVAIFQLNKINNTIGQICGGSIIHTNLVISAAHCFWDPVNMVQIDSSYYKVAAGKFRRSWHNDLPENLKRIQKSDVAAIYFPKSYGGDDQNQQSDLALLQLTTPFGLTNSVRAICYDLIKENFDAQQTEPGTLGKVAGWGRTDDGEPSEELKTLDLPVIGYTECHRELSKYKFSRYLTNDKMCAGYLNGSALCQGDSGGGLVFPSTDRENNTRWYLRGLVSIGPLNEAKTSCRSNTYTAFTQIFKMRDWLKRTIKRVTRPSLMTT